MRQSVKLAILTFESVRLLYFGTVSGQTSNSDGRRGRLEEKKVLQLDKPQGRKAERRSKVMTCISHFKSYTFNWFRQLINTT